MKVQFSAETIKFFHQDDLATKNGGNIFFAPEND